jgi:hypothetical protein
MNWIEKLLIFHLIAWKQEWKNGLVRTPRYIDMGDLIVFGHKESLELYNMSLHLGKPLCCNCGGLEFGMQMPESNMEEFNDDKVWSIV